MVLDKKLPFLQNNLGKHCRLVYPGLNCVFNPTPKSIGPSRHGETRRDSTGNQIAEWHHWFYRYDLELFEFLTKLVSVSL